MYGIRLDPRPYSWYYAIINIFAFNINDLIVSFLPKSCLGSMNSRLVIGAVWPYIVIFLMSFGAVIIAVMTKNVECKRGYRHLKTSLRREGTIDTIMSRLLYFTIVLLYLVLPSVSRSIFDAIKCRAFKTDDTSSSTRSYLTADLGLQCDQENVEYASLMSTFWVLFFLWPVMTPLAMLILLLSIRRSVRSNRISRLAELCRFLWRDYNKSMILWDFIDTIRKLFLVGLIMFFDREEGSTKIFRLVVATVISGSYICVLSLARPYKEKDDLYLSILSNMFLLCSFASGVIMKLCEDDESGTCQRFIGMNIISCRDFHYSDASYHHYSHCFRSP